jgi:Astacin (Peptidase family M12A)
MKISKLLAGALIAAMPTADGAKAQDLVFRGKPSEYEDYGYMVRGAAWQFKPGEEAIIFVCWENPATNNEESRYWIRDQIEKTWEKHAAVDFRGWEKCAETNSGVRILLSDVGPHVKAFGRRLDRVKGGMILNDTFKNWGELCQKTQESCVRSIAVHEFGHALGFAHEQNRPDTPGECVIQHGQDQPNEEMLTPYDPYSVMNYCNSKYNNGGMLSKLDIETAKKIYGAR